MQFFVLTGVSSVCRILVVPLNNLNLDVQPDRDLFVRTGGGLELYFFTYVSRDASQVLPSSTLLQYGPSFLFLFPAQ